ncbi:unnamed protein product [Gongylonema pulchrum]|uniref:Aldo_ket_red domain-containing protein n=1 Tax=Gongylonema pulchrum TaxID=637853 RepID=A0A183DT28_9BILA|nr:unnamed protein product [Gongylonema pulchrum]
MSLASCAGGVAKLNTGYCIPMVGLGTYKITGQQAVSAAVDAALQAGYRLFDTAKYLDLVLIHYPKADACENDDVRNPQNRMDAYMELEKLKDERKVRSVGVSNYEVKHIKEIENFGKMMPSVNQVEFHPHFTRNELREYCSTEGIFFQAYSSLARNHPDLMNEAKILEISEAHKCSPQLVLLVWALGLGVGIIPKSATPERVIDNFKVVNLKLTEQEINEISKLDRNKNYIRCDGWNVVNLKLTEQEINEISKLDRNKNYIRCDGWNVN